MENFDKKKYNFKNIKNIDINKTYIYKATIKNYPHNCNKFIQVMSIDNNRVHYVGINIKTMATYNNTMDYCGFIRHCLEVTPKYKQTELEF